MSNFFENLADRSRLRAVATIMNGFERDGVSRHWICKAHDDDLVAMKNQDAPARRRALAFLDHVEAFAVYAGSRDILFERVEQVAWHPQRYHDVYAPTKLRWKPLHRWIYDRVGTGGVDGEPDYAELRPLLDPAYRMASAIADDPSIVEKAKIAAAPAAFAREERDEAGDLKGYVVPLERISILPLHRLRDELVDEIEFLDDLSAAGLRVDRTSEIGHRPDGFFVEVPNGRRIRVIGEDLGSLDVVLPCGGGDVAVSVHLRDLRYDGLSYRLRADIETDGGSASIVFSDRCRPGEKAGRFPAEAYDGVAFQRVNEHRNRMPFLPDDAKGISPDMARTVRSDWTRRIHAAVLDRLDDRLAPAGAR